MNNLKNNIELLSPVGNFECLKAAVQNGADSVYFGADTFSARASATNFSLEELKSAIQYAKIRFFLGKTNIFHKNNTQKQINVVLPYAISPGPTEKP